MDEVYKHWLNRFVYTAGVKWMAQEAAGGNGAYWLIDAVASHQRGRLLKEEFQVWRLKVNEDKSAVLTCDDGNGNILVTQNIPFTDYGEPECELYLVGGPGQPATLMLPSEY